MCVCAWKGILGEVKFEVVCFCLAVVSVNMEELIVWLS